MWVLAAVAGLTMTGMGALAVESLAAPATQEEQGGRPLAQFIRARIGRLIALRDELNVTREQRNQLRQIARSHRDEIVPAVKDIAAGRRTLRDAVLAAQTDDAAIRAAADQLGKSIGDAAVLIAKVVPEAKAVLTPEQLERIREFREEREKSAETFLDEFLAE
jgi:Spy/CpxP family protein refolding chaperone